MLYLMLESGLVQNDNLEYQQCLQLFIICNLCCSVRRFLLQYREFLYTNLKSRCYLWYCRGKIIRFSINIFNKMFWFLIPSSFRILLDPLSHNTLIMLIFTFPARKEHYSHCGSSLCNCHASQEKNILLFMTHLPCNLDLLIHCHTSQEN